MKQNLLILDDEVLILKSLENLLEDDYEVFTAHQGETALRLAADHEIAVILCDERMPGMAGHDFLRRVREISSATRVMMSGYADIAELTEAVNRGQIFSYIAKPWEPLKLMAQVKAAAVHFTLVQEVEKERGLLRALMENIPDLIFFKDLDSRFTRVNQAHAQHLGAPSAEECIGKSEADYLEAEDALSWRRGEERILKSGEAQIDRIEQFKIPSGGLEWWSTTQVPMFDRSGHITGIAGISRNITAWKHSEEMLREQNERNRMILETAYDAFIGMEPDGTITAWNPRAALTFGWSSAEAIGRTLCDTVVAPAYRAAHAKGVEQFLTTCEGSQLSQPIELIALHRDGHEFPVEATVWPVRLGGACSFNAFVRDISERLLSEEARRKEAALLQLLQAVTVAANQSSSIRHTAKTCLDLICSYAGWPVGHLCLALRDPTDRAGSPEIWLIKDERLAALREAAGPSSPARGAACSAGS